MECAGIEPADATLLAYTGPCDRDRLVRGSALGAGITALLLLTPTYLSFSLN